MLHAPLRVAISRGAATASNIITMGLPHIACAGTPLSAVTSCSSIIREIARILACAHAGYRFNDRTGLCVGVPCLLRLSASCRTHTSHWVGFSRFQHNPMQMLSHGRMLRRGESTSVARRTRRAFINPHLAPRSALELAPSTEVCPANFLSAPRARRGGFLLSPSLAFATRLSVSSLLSVAQALAVELLHLTSVATATRHASSTSRKLPNLEKSPPCRVAMAPAAEQAMST